MVHIVLDCIGTSTTYTHIKTARLIDPPFWPLANSRFRTITVKILKHSETITVLPNVFLQVSASRQSCFGFNKGELSTLAEVDCVHHVSVPDAAEGEGVSDHVSGSGVKRWSRAVLRWPAGPAVATSTTSMGASEGVTFITSCGVTWRAFAPKLKSFTCNSWRMHSNNFA